MEEDTSAGEKEIRRSLATLRLDTKWLERSVRKLDDLDALRIEKLHQHLWILKKELKLIQRVPSASIHEKMKTVILFDVDGTLTPPSRDHERSLRAYAVRTLSRESEKKIYADRQDLLSEEEVITITDNIILYIEENLTTRHVNNLQQLFRVAHQFSDPFALYFLSRNSSLITEIYLTLILRGSGLPSMHELFNFEHSRFRHNMRHDTDDKGYHMIKILESLVREYTISDFFCCMRVIFFDDGFYNQRDAERESLTFPRGFYFIPFYLPAYDSADELWLGAPLAYSEAVRVITNEPVGTLPREPFAIERTLPPPFRWTTMTLGERRQRSPHTQRPLVPTTPTSGSGSSSSSVSTVVRRHHRRPRRSTTTTTVEHRFDGDGEIE